MRHYVYYLAMGTVVFFLTTASVFANFRCEGRFVDGYTKLDLLSHCGQPALRDSYSRNSYHGNAAGEKYRGCERVDQWHYIEPRSKSTYVVEIERGFVKRVLRSRARSASY